MDKVATFDKFLALQKSNIPMDEFVTGLILTAVLSYILGWIYVRFGKSLSNRQSLGNNFVLIAVTTMIIITIVKSSLALSLGLVGALSIVRFRTAIKEPEELAYLFFTIALGLGFGANQRAITIFGFVAVCTLIISRNIFLRSRKSQNLFLTIQSESEKENLLKELSETVTSLCSSAELKRFDQSEKDVEASFHIELKKSEDLAQLRENLRGLDSKMKISFIDNNWV